MHDKLISSLKIISGKEHLRIVGIALAYFFAHQLAFMFPDAEQVIMALWPAGGIGLAAFLLNPLRLWPAIILSFYVAGVSADVFLAHRTFFASVGYMTGNMVESVGCALLIIRCCGRDVRFERLREVLVLAAGVIFVNAFSSCIGAGTALLIRGASFWNAWLSWYVSDGLGVLLLTPLIVSWIGFLDFSRSVRWGRVAEAIAFMVLWCAATWLSFKPDMATHAFSPHPYMLSALLVWPALRFGQRGTTLALVVMGCIAISSNTASWSPEFLGGESPVDRLLALQVFVGFTSIVGFLLAATFSETRRSEEALRKLNEHLDLKVKERTGELEQEIAERKKAEGSLLLLQYAVDYAEDSIFWIRPDASFANVNNATCQRLGYTRNELLGMSVFDIDPAFPREAWDSHWREIKERKSFAIETKHKTKGGEIFPVEVSVNYVEYEGEEYNFAFAKDITQRKEAENALRNANELLEAQVKRRTTELQSVNEQLQRELADRKKSEELLIKSEEKFSKFFMFAPAAISVSSLDEGRIFDINKEYERVLGYSRDEVIGSTSRELGLFVDVKEREQIARILRAGGHVKDFELHLYNKSGKVTTLRYCGEMTEIENVSYLLSSFVDITDRKQAEQALEQAATEWSAAMDASEDVIYLLDIKRHVIRANKAFYTMTGKTPENAIGVHIVEILHPDKTPDLCPVCRAQEEKLDTVIIMEKDHECNPVGRPLEITVRILRDKQGQPISIFTMIHDLSRDRKSQEEKTRLEMQLFQSQKMEAIGHLAGGIAHDFNNMLTAIMGYGSLLNTKLKKDSELKPFVDQILSSAEKSANLTRQLLAFSRKQEILPIETGLNEIIKGMEKLLLRLIGEDIELKTQLTDNPLTVMVDPGQIEQVLMNLSTNARDAMPNGGMLSICTGNVELDDSYVKGHDMDKPGMYAIISVTDTGSGMDEKTQQKIFEPFYTTKEVGRGSGLGLSIVYGIIKQHGGNITVYSELGKGTTFRIYLPLIESKTEEAKVTGIITPKGGTETILLAEDNEDVRVLSKRVLEENGYKVIDAVDGEDAINKFKENKESIRFIIIDVIMPKKSGKVAIDEIRKIKPDVKVLFTSGYTSDIISRKGILEEGMDFISKPVTPHTLLMKTREILDGGKR